MKLLLLVFLLACAIGGAHSQFCGLACSLSFQCLSVCTICATNGTCIPGPPTPTPASPPAPAPASVTPKFSAAAVFGIAMGAGALALCCIGCLYVASVSSGGDVYSIFLFGGAGVVLGIVTIIATGLALGLSPSMCCA